LAAGAAHATTYSGVTRRASASGAAVRPQWRRAASCGHEDGHNCRTADDERPMPHDARDQQGACHVKSRVTSAASRSPIWAAERKRVRILMLMRSAGPRPVALREGPVLSNRTDDLPPPFWRRRSPEVVQGNVGEPARSRTLRSRATRLRLQARHGQGRYLGRDVRV
jgi:hypothetical protein